MRVGGKLEIGLLAVLGMLALPSAAAASTTITVNSQLDEPLKAGATTCESKPAKDCTLLAATELANEESKENSGETVTVDVPEGTYEHTLLPAEGILYAGEGASVAIDGAGAGKTIIDGGGVTKLFEVEEEATLKLKGVTVQHGSEEEGGGIETDGDDILIVEESAIEDNHAEYDGGGIYGNEFSYIAIRDSTIDHNTADNGGGVYANFDSIVAVSDSTIEDNTAAREDGGGFGGGVYVRLVGENGCVYAKSATKTRAKAATAGAENSAELTVQQSTIDHNKAVSGGGIYAWQDNVQCPAIGQTKHASAHARAKAAASHVHRALIIGYNDAANLSIEQSTIAYNRAEETEEEGGYGGGIFEAGYIYDPIVNSTISDNFATFDGGGIYAGSAAYDALINDTVFDNLDEPVTRESTAKRAAREGAAQGKAKPAGIATGEGPGNNLATEIDSNEGSEIQLRNTIVAEPKGQENCEGEFSVGVPEGGYNLDYPSNSLPEHPLDTCGLEETNNLRGVNPQLEEELKSNGGPTQTLALTSSSPAIGYVPLSGDCEEGQAGWGPAMRNEKGELEKPVDQRGEKRPGLPGRGCDIGAYELQAAAPVAPPPPPPAIPPVAPAASVLPFKFTVSPQCTSKRDITIHIQNVKQFGIVSAVVEIDGHHKKTLTGSHLTTAINLRGLPTGTFTIEIVARTRSGQEITGKRVYHTCHSKLPGHSYLPL